MAGKITTQLVIDAVNKTKDIFDKVGRDLEGLKQDVLSVGKVIAGAIGVDAFAGMVRGAAQAVGEMSRLAQLSNTSATTFQKWSAAASSVGIEGDKLGDIFKDVQEKFGEFAATGGGGAKDFFEQIAPKVGLTAEQFKNLSGPDALQLYVRGLEKANLTQDQMIFYLESLASDSSLLLPLLRDSGAQLEEMGTQAERLGRILDEKTTQNIKAFNSALKNLDSASETFKQQATGVVGQLDTMTGASNTAAGSIDRLSRVLNKVSSAEARGWVDRFLYAFKLLSAAPVLDAAWGGDAYKKPADSAKKSASTIIDSAAAGENTYGFEGFIKSLQQIELAANGVEQTAAEEKIQAIRAELEHTKKYADQLKKIDIKTELDTEAIAATQAQMEQLAKQLGATMRIPVVPVVAGTLEPIAQNTNDVSGYATGGYIRGPGTGTSDSILARLSNGEFVMRAAAVRHYGPALMAAMNGLQLPKFADGGLVEGVSPSMPHLGKVDLSLGGETTTIYVDESAGIDLRRLAMKHGRTSRR